LILAANLATRKSSKHPDRAPFQHTKPDGGGLIPLGELLRMLWDGRPITSFLKRWGG